MHILSSRSDGGFSARAWSAVLAGVQLDARALYVASSVCPRKHDVENEASRRAANSADAN
jgi:hypothetical protein